MSEGRPTGGENLGTTAYLFDAKGEDRKLDLDDVSLTKIKANQLLWINILGREKDAVAEAVSDLGLKNVPLHKVLITSERPKIEIFEDFYRFFIISVKVSDNGEISKIPIDFLVGKNYVITVNDGEVEFFKELTAREKTETHLGGLDAESFVAMLLDLHIVTYFRALEEIEEKVDKLDHRILRTDIGDHEILTEMVTLRKRVSKMRRWLLPHRDVFYAFARPDFQQIAQSDSAEQFKLLNSHFESAVDAIESSRDTVLSLFDLFTSKTSQKMNRIMQRLTFITLLVGTLGAIAGIWGMNFEVSYFKSAETGFWMTILVMGILTAVLTIFAWLKRWL
jgi:magnesium/cobalt transport protein CorA